MLVSSVLLVVGLAMGTLFATVGFLNLKVEKAAARKNAKKIVQTFVGPSGPTLMEKIEIRLSNIEDKLGLDTPHEMLSAPLTASSSTTIRLKNIDMNVAKLMLKGDKQMTAITDLTNLVATLTADVAKEADEVKVAVDTLKQALSDLDAARNDPAIKAAVDALTTAHASLSATTDKLKAGVDSASASGGPATK